MSTNTEKPVVMGAQDNVSNARKKYETTLLVRVIILAAIILVAALVYYLIQTGGGKHSASYSREQMTNGGYTYSIIFNKNAKQSTQKNVHSLEGTIPGTSQKQTFTATPVANVPEPKDCIILGIGWKNDFSFNLNGINYRTCSLNNTAYLVLIKSGQQQHLIRLTASGSDRNGQDQVNAKKIFSSLVVHKS